MFAHPISAAAPTSTMETIDGYEDDRDPETAVIIKQSTTSGAYHEIDHDGSICCRSDTDPSDEKMKEVTLETAIRKWKEPCQQQPCQRVREGYYEPYKKSHLKYLYHNENLSAAEIGEFYGVKKEGIRGMLHQYGISMRTPEEANRVRSRREVV